MILTRRPTGPRVTDYSKGRCSGSRYTL